MQNFINKFNSLEENQNGDYYKRKARKVIKMKKIIKKLMKKKKHIVIKLLLEVINPNLIVINLKY